MHQSMILALVALAACGGLQYDELTAEQELMLTALTGEEEEAARDAMMHGGLDGAVDQPLLFRFCDADLSHTTILETYDADADGKLGPAEEDRVWTARDHRDRCETMRRARLWHTLTIVYDNNGSGSLERPELVQIFEDFTTRCEARHEALVADFDADLDGELTEEDLAGVQTQIEGFRAERQGLCADGDDRDERGEHEDGDREDHDGDFEGHDGECDGDEEHEFEGEEERGDDACDRRPGPPRRGLFGKRALPPLLAQFDIDRNGKLSNGERNAVKERIRSGELLIDPEHRPMGPR